MEAQCARFTDLCLAELEYVKMELGEVFRAGLLRVFAVDQGAGWE